MINGVVIEKECESCGGHGRRQINGAPGAPCHVCEQGVVRETITLEEFAKLFTWGSQQTKDADGNWGILNVLRVERYASNKDKP